MANSASSVVVGIFEEGRAYCSTRHIQPVVWWLEYSSCQNPSLYTPFESPTFQGLTNQPPPPTVRSVRPPLPQESSSVLSSLTSPSVAPSSLAEVLQRWSDPSMLLPSKAQELVANAIKSEMIPRLPSKPGLRVNPMSLRVKFGSQGSTIRAGIEGTVSSSLLSPHGFCLGPNEQIFVADTQNHCIKVFDINGHFLYAFGTAGDDDGQLYFPRKVAVMRSKGWIVVCDRGKDRTRIQIFTCKGAFVRVLKAKYIDIVASIAVNQFDHIVVVDSNKPTIYQIDENGALLRWINCSDYMKEPSDIAVYGNEYYVCDYKGHCVVVFSDSGHFLRKIGGEPLTMFPNGVDISDAGDLLVCDSHGNKFHIVVFSRDGSPTAEFECPYIKVSRCSGLKITSQGLIVTLAKNNHQVLVVNTLYIQ